MQNKSYSTIHCRKITLFCQSNFAYAPCVGLVHVPLQIALNRLNDIKYILTKPMTIALIAVISGFNT